MQSVELTNEAIEFLKGIFDLYDSDGVSSILCQYGVFNIAGWLSICFSVGR